jgi:hypothetical protein
MRKFLTALVLCVLLALTAPARADDRTISRAYFQSDGWTYYPILQNGSVYGFLCLLESSQVDGYNLSAVYYQRQSLMGNTWRAYTWPNGTQQDAIKYAVSELAVTVTPDDPVGTEWGIESLPANTVTPAPLDKVAPADDFVVAVIEASTDKEATVLTLKDAGFAVATLKPGVAALKGDCSETNILNAYAAGVEAELSGTGYGKMLETIYNSLRTTCYPAAGPLPDPTQIISAWCQYLCGVVNNVSGVYIGEETGTPIVPATWSVTPGAASNMLPGCRNCTYEKLVTDTKTRTRTELSCGSPCKLKMCTQTRTQVYTFKIICEDCPGGAGACPDDPPCAGTQRIPVSDTGWTPSTCP